MPSASGCYEPQLKFAELLLGKGMQDEARARLQELVQGISPSPRAHYLLAVVLSSQGAMLEAEQHFRQALQLAPEDYKALNGLAVLLQQSGRVEEAQRCYRHVISINPRYQDARINLALLLKEQGELGEAEKELLAALRDEPASVRIRYNHGNVLHLQGRPVEAVAAYRETLRLAPEHLEARQNLLFALHYPDSFPDAEIFEEHLKVSRSAAFRPTGRNLRTARDLGSRRIRVGYLSPDFRDHAVARFIEPVLAHHDRSRFEIFCYSNVAQPDQITRRLQDLAEQWREIHALPDEKAAFIIESDGIDILIDLAGHTSGNRLPLFARGVSPLQITWIGYPDTTGLPQIDYRITDWLADPPGRESFHVEGLIRLPRIFCCYQPPPETPEVGPLPCDSAGRVTFGSFNNLAKVTPEVIGVWSRVLRAVPGSAFLVKSRQLADPVVRSRILDQFQQAGIQRDRIELQEGNLSTTEHLSQYHRIDIALDTFPYNGTTTTCEALWMGVPVVTVAGSRHAARTGVSILTNCGLAGLVAKNGDRYVWIARELARDRHLLREIRRKLRGRMQASPVMDGAGVTRDLEEALLKVMRKHSESGG